MLPLCGLVGVKALSEKFDLGFREWRHWPDRAKISKFVMFRNGERLP